MKKKDGLKLFIIIGILFLFDMLTKYLFYNLELLNSLEIIKPIINTGVSFGFKISIFIVVTISILALGLFGWLFHKKNINGTIAGLLISGTLGNLVDRLIFGGVRDFISIGNFPIFNIADCLLNIGIFLFFIKEFFNSDPKNNSSKVFKLITK